MAVRWNDAGNFLLSLRNLKPPLLTDITKEGRSLEFDADCYFNACTMKSCCFAGDNDEYIMSGSDDFNLYMWKIPESWPAEGKVKEAHLTLSGHRSIVNQVRYCPNKQVIATSGVEKIIKFWSPYYMPYSQGNRDVPAAPFSRRICRRSTCLQTPGDLQDTRQGVMTEDTDMIHFFDSLLHNELEGRNYQRTQNSEELIQRRKRIGKKMISKSGCTLKHEVTSTTDRTSVATRRYYVNILERNDVIVSDDDNEDEVLVPYRRSISPSSSSSSSDAGVVNSSSSDSSTSSNSPHQSSSSGRIRKVSVNLKDSGINLSENHDSDENSDDAIFIKKKKIVNKKRNYRKRKVEISESESEDENKPSSSTSRRSKRIEKNKKGQKDNKKSRR